VGRPCAAGHDTVAAVRRRIAAWVVTGPLGHGYAGAADVLDLALRHAWSRRGVRRVSGS